MLDNDLNLIAVLDFDLKEVIFAALLYLLEKDDTYSTTLTKQQLAKGKDFCYKLEEHLREEITYE